jgi:hypothetical protein
MAASISSCFGRHSAGLGNVRLDSDGNAIWMGHLGRALRCIPRHCRRAREFAVNTP